MKLREIKAEDIKVGAVVIPREFDPKKADSRKREIDSVVLKNHQGFRSVTFKGGMWESVGVIMKYYYLVESEEQPTIKSIAESVHKKEIKKNKEALAHKYTHYYKSVEGIDFIDVYDVLKLFDVNDPCLQHAIKKLFALGGRGHKDHDKDFKDVMDSLERYQIMREEHATKTK